MNNLSEADIRKIVAETVTETMLRLGIDASEPTEMQRDLQHLRDWRLSVSAIKRQGMLTAIGVVTAGLLGLVWMAITGKFN